jgi:acyl-CoA synthetase (AMP-forming)/AMP-acid ligase II
VAEATIIDVLDSHADRLADKVAFRFLEDGEVESRSLTYGGLDDLSNRIAATLIGIASAGARALLLYPAGRQDDFIVAFLGCLKAGVIAVPLYAPHARRVDERLNAITVDCQPTLTGSAASWPATGCLPMLDALRLTCSLMRDRMLHAHVVWAISLSCSTHLDRRERLAASA